jgi:hypothetical protein
MVSELLSLMRVKDNSFITIINIIDLYKIFINSIASISIVFSLIFINRYILGNFLQIIII